MEYYDGIGPRVKPRAPRQLLTATDLQDLAATITALDNSGATITGNLEFKGHVIPMAYDHTTNRHYVSL